MTSLSEIAGRTQTVVVDPVTRIEGHLRIEAQFDGSKITQAISSGAMVRGIEIILRDRDPRDAWAFAQRICGVCTLVHGIASVRAVEHALDYPIPENAQLIRNLMMVTQFAHDHVVHFYHLQALDWVDVVAALKADPNAASAFAQSISTYARATPGYFADVQLRLKTLIEAGQLGIFANGYWGHPGYRLPPEANLMVMAHYFDALAWQRQIVQLQTIFGGKDSHPNVLVGGVPAAISVYAGAGTATPAVNEVCLQKVTEIIASMRQFIAEIYVPDLLAIGGYYKDWFAKGYGEGTGNFMTYGDFPNAASLDPKTFLVPRGAILNRDLSTIHEVDLTASGDIQEFVAHSWYDYDAGKAMGLHPYQGETRLKYSGPTPPCSNLDATSSYSWIKSPRWKGHAMEMGPLARIVMMYAAGHAPTVALTNESLGRLGLPFEALYSVMGRNLARALECQILTDAMPAWQARLQANIAAGDVRTFNEKQWERSSWPSHAQGVGCVEAPRGSLAHWIVIDGGLISNYQAVVATAWNAGPRDAADVAGPYEAALEGIHLTDPKQPLEILRTVHSFDPCLACAVHFIDPAGAEPPRVRLQ